MLLLIVGGRRFISWGLHVKKSCPHGRSLGLAADGDLAAAGGLHAIETGRRFADAVQAAGLQMQGLFASQRLPLPLLTRVELAHENQARSPGGATVVNNDVANGILAVVHFSLPIIVVVPWPWNLLGTVPILFGVAIAVIARQQFARRQTTIKPMPYRRCL
jgi:hypothetical protein